jgi:hypothetical protein
MADYYPLLAKALANLPTRAAPTARRAIYERARKALIGQLRSIRPPVPESDIAVEDAALDEAIARLEAEYGAQPAAAPVAARPAPAPAKPAPSASPSIPAARPAPTPRPPPSPPPSPKPSVTPAAAVNPLPRAPIAPPPTRRPTMGSSLSAAATGARVAPAVDPEAPLASDASSVLVAPAYVADHTPNVEDAGLEPPILAPTARAGVDIARPSAPGPIEAPRRGPWLFVALAMLICVAAAIAAVAYFWREKPADIVVKAPTETTDGAPQAGQNKIADRINPPGAPGAGPTVVETPIPTVTVPVARVPAPAPTPAPAATPAPATPPAPAAVRTADNATSAAATPAPAPAAAIPGSSRAAILIGTTSDPQKPLVNLGSAVWSILPANAGQPASLAVRIEVDIPDQKMHATITIRKNADASLPATHTIDLRATFADGAEIKGLKDMGLPQLRKDDAPTGDQISGVRVKINDSYYLVGLTRSDADAAHNLDLLATRPWFDFPLLLNDDRIAKLTFTKGEAGDRAMAQALDAWK